MAKLRHIAFISPEPPRLFDYYHHLFGLEEVRVSPSGSVHVIDGLFNLAFLAQQATTSDSMNTHRADGHELDQSTGIAHYGFAVEDIDEALARFDESIKRGESPQNGRPAEVRIVDPWGNQVDLSSRGFLGREERKLPGIRHVVVQTDAPDEARAFYRSSFDLAEVEAPSGGATYLSDGDITMRFTAEHTIDRAGIQYFGVQIDDWEGTRARFASLGEELGDPPPAGSERMMTDPEGNHFAVSLEGWG